MRAQALRSALRGLATLNAGPLPWDRALRFALAIGAPAALGLALGNPAAGVIAGLCAMLTSFNDLGGTLRHRLVSQLATALAITIAGTLGGLAGRAHWLPIVSLFASGYIAGRIHGSSAVMESIARQVAMAIVVPASLKLDDPRLIPMVLGGGAWAMLVVAADHAVRRVDPPDRSGGWRAGFDRLRAGRTAGWRFAASYALMATMGLLLGEEFGAERAAWITVTSLLVMRPDGAESMQFVLNRMVGTLIGVGVAAAVVIEVADPWLLAACAFAVAFAIPPCFAWHRWIGVAAVTATVLVLLDLALLWHGGGRALLGARVYDTVLGCALAVCGTLLAFPELWRGGAAPPGGSA